MWKWVGQIEEQVDRSIYSFSELTLWYQEDTKNRWNKYEALVRLGEALGDEDPLVYLYSLYYDEKKSLLEILKVDIFKNIDFLSKATLHRLLFQDLGWVARKNTDKTPIHWDRVDAEIWDRIREFNFQVERLLVWKTVDRVFFIEELHEKQYRIQKALYILNTLWWIDKWVLLTLSIEWWLSDATLAHALNHKIEEIIKNHPRFLIPFDEVKLYPQSISRWFKYNAEKTQDN